MMPASHLFNSPRPLIQSVFNWLKKHKVAAVLLGVAYSSATIFPHDVLQTPALAIQQQTGMVAWHFGLLIFIVAGLVVMGITILRSNETRSILHSSRYYALAIAALLVAGSTLLMVNSVEHIHYLQYAVLVLILSPVFGRVGLVVAVAILIGAFDEGYQYFVLHPWQPYFDFNDIVLNGFGAVAGGLAYKFLTGANLSSKENWSDAASLWLIGGWTTIFILIIVLFSIGYLGSFSETGHVILNRFPRPDKYGMVERWIDTGWGNHWFKLQPGEGLTISFLLPFLLKSFYANAERVEGNEQPA